MRHIKKHLKRLHKIKVHDNRWLAWAVVFIFIGLMSLSFYINITDHLFVSEDTGAPKVLNAGVVYLDSYLGFELQHPVNWGIDSQDRNIINFNDPRDLSHGMEVGLFEPADEAAIRKTLSIKKEVGVTIDGKAARMVTSGEGAAMEQVIFVHHEDRLYVVRGNTPWFENMAATITFIPLSRTINE